MQEFDLVVIGSGPGGYIAAIRASQLGFKVAIVEKYKELGGTCLNVGCIPSKAWLDSSEKYFELNHKYIDHGIESSSIKLDVKKMSSRVSKVVQDITEGVSYLMKKNKITVFVGKASFESENVINIANDKKDQIKGSKFIIATGSKPSNLPGILIDKKRIITSTEALKLQVVPKHLIVVGGGVIGLEMGSVFKRLGAKVTVVEYAESLLPFMDKDCGKELLKVLKAEGMEFHFGVKVNDVKANSSEVTLNATQLKDQSSLALKGDFCLLSVGRKAYTEGLNLEKIGIELDQKGKIPVNKNLQTKHAHIYAIGDVIDGPMLAHKAEEEGVFVAEIIAGQKPHLNYDLIPSVIYTWPEVASVGKTEDDLKKLNIPFKIGKFPMGILGRAKASQETFGFIKVIAHKETDEVLGVHMVGPRVADIISEATLAMEFKASAEDIARVCHAHPTYAEALKEAALIATENRPLNM